LVDPKLHNLIERRIQEISIDGRWDADSIGYFIVAEVGDSVAALETESGCPILGNLFDDIRFPHEDFSPGFEWLEDHDGYYEAVWILNDDGFAVAVFIPKQPDIDPDLLTMCATYATPPPAAA
jgi:hypothetical protein